MKSILLIGLGRFGATMAMKLHELKHEVMAIDISEERINAILPYVTSAQIGDCTNEQYMSSIGVRNFDLCIVAIGDNFQSSLETTALLKDLGAKFVLSAPTVIFTPVSASKRRGSGCLSRKRDGNPVCGPLQHRQYFRLH